MFRDLLGDYLAIAKTNKTINYDGDSIHLSHHAGGTDEELFIPLVVVDCIK